MSPLPRGNGDLFGTHVFRLYNRSELTERVRVVHTSDTYGSTAAAAFALAARRVSVEMPLSVTDDLEEVEPTLATVEIVST